MRRRLSTSLALFLACSVSSYGDLILSSDLLSSSGGSDVYAIRLIGATSLAAYNIEVTVQAPGLPDESAFQAEAPSSGYVFADASNFFAGVNAGGGEVRITLTDFTASPVDTVSGSNDLIALITIDTTLLTGPLVLGFAADSLVLIDLAGEPVAGFEELRRSLQIVPEPSSLLTSSLAIGLMAACAAARSSRSRGDASLGAYPATRRWSKASRSI